MELWPTAKYKREGIKRGIDDETLDAAVTQARHVQKRGFPAVLSLRHLGEHVNVSYDTLREIVSRRSDPYRAFPVRKRPTGYRVICVPQPELMRLQRWVNQHVLRRLKPHASAAAYSRNCSPLRCAESHAGCQWLIKVDIRRFFESIDERKVYPVFRECGYDALVAFELTRLTTRASPPEHRSKLKRWQLPGASAYTIKRYRAPYLGHLPQGAPTSPLLANLVMRPFDALADQIASDYDLTYTRYSDDLAFSSHDPNFTRKAATELIARVYGLLGSFALEPKSTKTNVVSPGARKVILGLTVNDNRPHLKREWKRQLECHVYFITKLGYVTHARERKFSSVLGCFRYVQGLVAYACQVDPEFGEPLRKQLATAAPPF
jgi:hypothetical protein